MLLITGFRRDDQFIAKTYANTEGHQLYLIEEVCGNEIKLRHDRFSSNNTLEEDYND